MATEARDTGGTASRHQTAVPLPLEPVPAPDELVFISNFSGGEVFRSGCCWQRGKGRVFYFSPGHETYPIYHHEEIQKVLANAVEWAFQDAASSIETASCPNAEEGWFQ